MLVLETLVIMNRESSLSFRKPAGDQLNVPPVPIRRDLTSLRRFNSENQEYTAIRKVPHPKQYESEYDKLSRYLQNSGNISRAKGHRNTTSHGRSFLMDHFTRPRSQTELRAQDYDEELYMAHEEIASAPSSKKVQAYRTKTSPLPISGNEKPDIPRRNVAAIDENFHMESAIYGIAQGKGPNLVMELKDMQKTVKSFYNTLHNMSLSDPRIADLRTHLRQGENSPLNDILLSIHETLRPNIEVEPIHEDDGRSEEYLIDFHHDCKEKSKLKERIMLLFTKPGPPSVAYQRINSKLDSVIDQFCETLVAMRTARNETLTSPFHAYSIIRSFTSASEGDNLSAVLHSNSIWIRWGTESGLPIASDLYLMKQPPSYEMRKAVVLSLLAERREKISSMLSTISSIEELIPPIYGKLNDGSDSWQVTEFNPQLNSMETHKTNLPHWIDECYRLSAHLRSGNRTPFKYGDHVYALYSVYLIVIKDITLADGSYIKESKAPSSHQIFVGSSTTGVLFKFQSVERNHCESVEKLLIDVQTMKNFRCHQDVTLVDACLALSWIRSQPRAIFVINSFQEGDMVNLSLNKKKPFYDKMHSLEQHYINSKKLGPSNDMRYGMNPLGDIPVSEMPS